MTNINIGFGFSANPGSVPGATKAMSAQFAALQKQIVALNSTSLAGVSREIKSIANPKFRWDEGLRQSDKLLENIKKQKLSAREFFQVMREGQSDLARHQQRISGAFMAPLGKAGATSMFIPAVKDMQGLSNAADIANQRLRIHGEILSGLGTKVQDWGKNTQWAGRQLMVGFTMPLAMAAAAAGSYALDIDKAIVRIEKVYDGAADKIRGQAFAVAADITKAMGTTIQSSLEMMGELAAAGKQGEELFKMTYQAQKLATLGSVEQEDAIKGIISIQNIYKMSVEELASAVDYLNIVEAATPTGIKDLVDAIPIAGAQVAQLGGNLQDTTILLTAFKERGISTVEGANAIKTAMNRILSPTRAAIDMFDKLTGESLVALVKSTEGKPLETFQALSDAIMGGNIALADQQSLITKIVGIYQSSRVTGLLNGLQEESGAVQKAKNVAQQSPEEWAKKTEKNLKAITSSMSGQFNIALEDFKAKFKVVGDVAIEVATMILKGFSAVFELFNAMPDWAQMLSLGAVGLIAIAGPITMLVGLTANLIGTSIKAVGALNKRRAGTEALTIAEKAAALQSDLYNKKMLTQAESTQILVFQMQQLQKAILGVTAAQTGANAAANAMAGIKLNGQQIVQGRPGEYRTNTGRPLNAAEAAKVDQLLLEKQQAEAKRQQLDTQERLTTETQKTTLAQRVFRTETMLTVAGVAAIAGTMTDAGSAAESWLNAIMLGAMAISVIGPGIARIGPALKNSKFAETLKNSSSGFVDSMRTAGSKVGSILRVAFSPVGLGITAGVLGLMALTRMTSGLSSATHDVQKKQQAINGSTEKWVEILGRTEQKWGQIRTETGEVKDTIESIAQSMRERMPELVESVRNASGEGLQNIISSEVLKLQGQGLQKNEILNSMNALLTAAGKKKDEIQRVLSSLELSFDFSDGIRDLDAFIKTSQDKFFAMNRQLAQGKSLGGELLADMGPSAYNEVFAFSANTAGKIKTDFLSRLAGMTEAEKALFSKKFVADMTSMFEQSFTELNAKAGGTMGATLAEAREKYFNYDKGAWTMDRAMVNTANQAEFERIKALELLIVSEQNLTKTILQGMGASEQQIKNSSVLTDIMPFIVSGNIKAEDAQTAYNTAIKQAAESGKAMTDEEKSKLAELVAVTFGLNAATLKTNGYSKAQKDAKYNTEENAKAIEAFAQSLRDVGGAADDLWLETANADAGFESLGTTVADQANKITDTVKDIYSGTMNDIYSIFSAQAEEQWAARLEAIADGFERKKKAIQKQIDDFDSSYENKQDKFRERWDAIMENSENLYDRRRKAIETQSDAQVEAIKKQIEAIEDQEDAEKERDEQRQRAYDAEIKRIERLTELANRNIDFNRALITGNLDEAARIQNNAGAVTASWSMDDAKTEDEDKQKAKEKRNKQLIDELNDRIDNIEKQKQAKLEALDTEEKATEKSLRKQQEMQQKAMERSRDIERQRLQNKLDSLAEEQKSVEKAERKKQEMNRRTLEMQLATLRAFVPQNEAQLNAHIARVQGVYNQHGIALTVKGGQWGQIIGGTLQNNVNRARSAMSNDAAWRAFGNSVANAITNGAFGMNLGEFMNLVTKGQLPKRMGGTNVPRQGLQFGGIQAYHAGGPIGDGSSNRLGRKGPLYSDEEMHILQKGEYVMNKEAVAKYGSAYMRLINSRNAPIPGPGPQTTNAIGPTGLFGAMAAVGVGQMMNFAIQNMAMHATSKYAQAGPVLGMTGAGTGAALEWAASQAGKPYIWGGVGPAGYDCSGFMSAITNFLTGKALHKRLFTTSSFSPGQGAGGLVPGVGSDFVIGVRRGNPGHMVGSLGGVNVESRGDRGVLVGKEADSPSRFPMQFYLPMTGRAGGVSGSTAGGPIKEIVRAVVDEMFGWGRGAQWSALDWLVNKESSWNPRAQNPRSTAYGLFQFLDSTWGTVGASKTSNPRLQAIAGAKYIDQRYGSPIGAQAFHMRNNWYDTGGDLMPGYTLAYNGTNRTETVLNARTREMVVDALEKATISYQSLAGVRKQPSFSGLASEAKAVINNDYSTGDININGAQFSMKELASMVSDIMDEKKRKTNQSRGLIK